VETDKLIEALKAAEDENGIASRMTIGHIKRLAEAVRELAWAVRFGWHKDEEEVIQRWADIYMVAEAIVKEMGDGSDT